MGNNISDIIDCFGCGVCARGCSRNIIHIRWNENGFYQPYIDEKDKCIDCGICRDVCSFIHNDLALQYNEIHSYAAWSHDFETHKKCSSGGVGFEVGRYLIENGYKAIGVRYNVGKQRAEHFMANTVSDYWESIGSKYIQSYTLDGWNEVNRDEKYLITGTPCQIDSFRRFMKRMRFDEDKFILLDFFCHGVPSIFALNKYIQIYSSKIGNIKSLTWRNKKAGWHDSWAMEIKGDKSGSIYKLKTKGDIFYKLFLGDFCMNPACQKNCRFKYNRSSADIRIGDLWGETYKSNEDGVSAAIAFTSKGNKILHACNCELIQHSFDIVAEGQMKENCSKAPFSFIAWYMLKSKGFRNEYSWKFLFLAQKIYKKVKRTFIKERKIG